jgi:hypothetical protein
LNLKEKERFWNEEKNKLNKKIDSLTQVYDKLKEEYNDKEIVLGDLTTSNKLLVKK